MGLDERLHTAKHGMQMFTNVHIDVIKSGPKETYPYQDTSLQLQNTPILNKKQLWIMGISIYVMVVLVLEKGYGII